MFGFVAIDVRISVFAVALGAPFWFDVLNRFMKVRQTGGSPTKTKK